MAKPFLWDRKACRNTPSMFGHPHMFGCHYMFGHPHICLDAPCMFGHPPYIWMPPVCFDVWMPPVHTQHKESMLFQTKGCPYDPIHLDAPICLDATLYVQMAPYAWTPPHKFGCQPVCLDTPIHLDTPIC